MLESLINPKRIEKGPWKMFFIGLLYATLSLILVKWFFAKDYVLSEYSGMIAVTFCVMFSLPFMYYIIKQEEQEDEELKEEKIISIWQIHKDAIYSFMWLFLGFVIAFAITFLIFQDSTLFNAQIETYCMINNQGDIEGCVERNTFLGENVVQTGAATKEQRLLAIVENNVYVMIFTLLFSLFFGAGAIFVLAWNASVIAAAISIFGERTFSKIPCGIIRYMIHGGPEIAAYFVTALAGAIFGVGVIRNGIKNPKFFKVVQSSIILLFIAMLLIITAGLIEVYLTPSVMNGLSKIGLC